MQDLLITFPEFRKNLNSIFFLLCLSVFFFFFIFDSVMKFSAGFFRRVQFCRRICFESNAFFALVFENNCAILVTRCHGSVSHEMWYWLIDHINADPLTVSGVCLMYLIIVFCGSEYKIYLSDIASVLLSFIVVWVCHSYLAILNFIRPQSLPA